MGSDCFEIRQRLERYLDGDLDEVEVEVLTIHIRDCGPCEGRADFERQLRAVVRVHATEAAPAGLIDRVRERCRGLGDC